MLLNLHFINVKRSIINNIAEKNRIKYSCNFRDIKFHLTFNFADYINKLVCLILKNLLAYYNARAALESEVIENFRFVPV
jgi:hypothetical protein